MRSSHGVMCSTSGYAVVIIVLIRMRLISTSSSCRQLVIRSRQSRVFDCTCRTAFVQSMTHVLRSRRNVLALSDPSTSGSGPPRSRLSWHLRHTWRWRNTFSSLLLHTLLHMQQTYVNGLGRRSDLARSTTTPGPSPSSSLLNALPYCLHLPNFLQLCLARRVRAGFVGLHWLCATAFGLLSHCSLEGFASSGNVIAGHPTAWL